MFNLATIITAAGRSTRFPPNKLLKILEDRTAIEHTVNTFTGFNLDIYVILGYQSELVHEVLDQRFSDRLFLSTTPIFIPGLPVL